MGSGPAHMTSFYHNPLFKDPLSKYSHFLGYQGLGLQHVDSAHNNYHYLNFQKPDEKVIKDEETEGQKVL